jgi:hypothetical protein
MLFAVTFQNGVLYTTYPDLQMYMAGLSHVFIMVGWNTLRSAVSVIFLPPIDQTQKYKEGRVHSCMYVCRCVLSIISAELTWLKTHELACFRGCLFNNAVNVSSAAGMNDGWWSGENWKELMFRNLLGGSGENYRVNWADVPAEGFNGLHLEPG